MHVISHKYNGNFLSVFFFIMGLLNMTNVMHIVGINIIIKSAKLPFIYISFKFVLIVFIVPITVNIEKIIQAI